MPEPVVESSCLCGHVRFEVTLPPRFCAHCHCSQCRRAHGAAFVTWVGFSEEALRQVAGEDELGHFETRTGATRSFCTRCGSTLFYRSARWPGEVHVTRASIAADVGIAPAGHVYVDHKADWWEIADELPRMGGETGTEPIGP